MYHGNSFDIRWMEGVNGVWGTNADGSEMIGGTNVYFNNPYWLQYRKTNDSNRNRLTGAINLRWEITNWLYAQAAVQRDGYSQEYKQVQPIGAAADPMGWMTEYEKNFEEMNYNFLIGFNKEFGDFNVGATFGGNKQSNKVKQYTVSDGGRPFIVDGLWSVNNLSDKRPAKSFTRYQVNSFYGTVDLGWKNQLFLNLTARNDWFSTLADDSNSYFYPSATASWVFTDSFKMPAWFDFGKIRAGVATASNGTSPYSNLLLYQLRNYTVNGQSVATQNNGNKYPNPALKPVKISEFEVGLNLAFLANRLTFDMAYYIKNTKDDIAVVSTSSASGYSSKVANVGEIRNNGFEFMVDAYPIRSKSFQWNTTFNFAYNNSEVKNLGEGVDRLSIDGASSRQGGVTVYNIVGQPYGELIGYKYKRNAHGQIILKDGLPQHADSQESLGNGVYKLTGGWNNSFKYKDFTLSFLIDFKFGAKIFSGTNLNLYSDGLHKNTLVGRDDPTAKYVFPGVNEDGSPNTTAVYAQ
jgi:outer membrane receptor protein involved in Fe transport